MHYVLLLFLKRQSPECITHLNQIKPSHKRKQDTFKLHLHSNESPWEVFLFVAADTFTLTNPCGCSPNPQPIPTYAETSDTRGHERMCFLVWPGRWPGAGQSGRGAGIWRRYLLQWERLPACCASSSVLPLLLRSWEREGRGEKKSKIRAGAATHNWSAVFFPVCRTGQPWNRVKPAVCSRISSLLWFEAPAQKTLLWGHFREKENCTFHLRATENFELKVISSSRGCDKVTQYVIMTLKGLPRLNKVTCMRDKVAVNWWALLA